jgi:hypothetical protein
VENAILVVLIGTFMAAGWFRLLPWWLYVSLCLAVLGAEYLFFPYISSFVPVHEERKSK